MNNQDFIMKTSPRTKRLHVRLTEEEAAKIKRESEHYSSIGHYIRCAVAEFSNVNARKHLAMLETLGDYYRETRNQLSWAGSNLNQTVKRANELAIAGQLTGAYVRDILFPTITATLASIDDLKERLEEITKKIIESDEAKGSE